MSFSDKLWIKLFAKFEGTDRFSNKFYSYLDKSLGKERRYVIYKGYYEPSKVSPAWFSWLHYLSPNIPLDDELNYEWQTHSSRLNLTGTSEKYQPEGIKNPTEFAEKIKIYQAWVPDNSIKKDSL